MFRIAEVSLGKGTLGVCPIPGRSGVYESDVSAVLRWGPDLVLTMVTAFELDHAGAGGLGDDLAVAGVEWRHLGVPDMAPPPTDTALLWPEASALAHAVLGRGGRVLTHCYGGCGRAGMVAMRLMVEAGEEADYALERLRDARPCAVQSEAQRAWAAIPALERRGWSP